MSILFICVINCLKNILVVPGIDGIDDTLQLSGVLYKQDMLYIQSWMRVPRPISKLAEYSLGRLFYTPCPADLQLPMGATLEIQRLQHIERLEQQMMWAQLSRQVSSPQVTCMAVHVTLLSMLWLSS